ncbi:ABC transporter ATP-binding protein [Aliiroseovarius lamellibrachiae]|uniref:ABC transporter ATP-binding protein n=1 Tax=Aliiroseovarius lamellibrachiae TaxID=1924933 RepID=UPI001BE01ABA|nr:ABC transporter ATP-binding protein [Aliiroseovarius lamellibrachiae]MBT2129939.1 ABC transporter ATP-binding protein [Aliiroseovarius lamellibrachiae]
MSALAISVQGLTKRYGDKTVVDAVSMDVSEGEIMGFLGPNGSGKTTTIRLMCGLLEPDAGEGRVLGHDIRRDRGAIKRNVGYMTQRFSFYEDLTIAENLNFVAGVYGMEQPRQAVRDTLEDLGLISRKDQLAGSLSGGWKQRLALAACVMHRPKLLILDEPTAGVDPKARRDFWDEIHRLAVDGLTVLVSTHYMDEAERCHRISYISYGRLVAQGTTEQVVRDAGLTTLVLSGEHINDAAEALRDAPGVEQIAPFGASLHVVGRHKQTLMTSVNRVAQSTGVTVTPTETSLEDVFIQLMGQSKDNML